MRKLYQYLLPVFVVGLAPAIASAQSFRVQCPTSTITHPDPANTGLNNSEPAYNGPTQLSIPATPPPGTSGGFVMPAAGTVNGAIKCQQISGGDGLMTEADGAQTFMFSFGPLSGLADVAAGHPSTQFPNMFNTPWPGCLSEATPSSPNTCPTPLLRGDPATTDGATSGAAPWTSTNPPATNPLFTWNGAVGLTPDISTIVTVSDLIEGPFPATTPLTTAPGCPTPTANTVTAWTDAPLGLPVNAYVVISNATAEGGTSTPAGYAGTWQITCVTSSAAMSPAGFIETAFQFVKPTAS